MTLDKLQRIVVLLANNCHVRWFAHFNHPERSPHLMALWPIEWTGVALNLELDGFTRLVQDGHVFWTIARTNEDGSPFVSNL